MRQVRLTSVRTNSGFLENAPVEFDPFLTCIIGARGTCKSTVVESIRFAFNSSARRIKEITSETGVITKTLGLAGSVKCELQVEDEGVLETFAVEREMDSEPRILRKGVRDSLSDELLQEIEIYSQGALQQIASEDRLDLRLELIDRPHRLEVRRIRDQVAKFVRVLQEVGPNLRISRTEVEKRKHELRSLEALRAELGATVATRPELPPTLEEHHLLYLRRQRTLELVKEVEEMQLESERILASASGLLPRLSDVEGDLQETGMATKDVYSLVNIFKNALSEVSANQRQIKELSFGHNRAVLAAAFEAANQDYYSQRQKQLVLNESLKREDQVRRRIAELEKIEKELQNFQAKANELVERRKNARLQLVSLSDQLFELRVQEVDRINKEFGDIVFLTIRRGTQSAAFVNNLASLLAGSRVRTQENIAEEIGTSLTPAGLLDVIENSDAQQLATLLGRDLGQVNRVLAYLRDHPDLYSLEGEPFDDVLEITMYDHGQPKAVESLSDGQKATALLPLILRASACPLIIDQPEDDLDNSFVFQVLVKNIVRLKRTRQLIFITHNANIPVLGDAEKIVVMHMERPSKAAAPLCGTVEECKLHILDLLEGGKEAFEKREKRYGTAK